MTTGSLHDRVTRLATLSTDWPDLGQRATHLLARTDSVEFRVAVVGEFKRGKSTLLNALLGRSLLPTGVLPVTTVPIELASGPERAVVVFADGRREEIPFQELALYTAESSNPENRLGVAHVEVFLYSPLLNHGLSFVDVPGMGSVHEGATLIARRTYHDIDGAILVLSADSPLSAVERRVALELCYRRARLFVVVNKADRLAPGEVAEVRAFVAAALELPATEVYCLSATSALKDRSNSSDDFERFVDVLDEFVQHDLVRTRLELLEREFRVLRNEVGERAMLERAAGESDLVELEAKIRSFQRAVDREWTRFTEDQRAIAAEVAALGVEVRARVALAATSAFPARRSELVGQLPDSGSLYSTADLVETLIESIVREEFDQIWAREVDWLDAAWERLFERYRTEAEIRLNAVRAVAAELFAAELQSADIPTIESAPIENLYHFVPPMTISDGLLDPIRRVVPARWLRGHLVKKAERSLERELDKHAGRAGAALDERLRDVWASSERLTRAHLERAVDGILDALNRASRIRDETESAVLSRRRRLDEIERESAAMAAPH
jgi:GTP-binding protein EngB required for normal cell division